MLTPLMAQDRGIDLARLTEGPKGPFIELPYLQLGDEPGVSGATTSALVLWHSRDEQQNWGVRVRTKGDSVWRQVTEIDYQPIRLWSDGRDKLPIEHWSDGKDEYGRPTRVNTTEIVALPTIEAHRVWSARLGGLRPGESFDYEVLLGEQKVFSASGKSRPTRGQPLHLAIAGDLGDPLPAPRQIAYQIHRQQPDLMIIPGDIVYSSGRVSEYRRCHFMNYNNDVASASTGAPLLRSVLTAGGLGEHDTGLAMTAHDLLGYYFYWSTPLNGPRKRLGDTNVFPLKPEDARQKALIESAGKKFPKMAHYSFDAGDAHFTFVDTAKHVDWQDPMLRDWLRNDLQSVPEGVWKVVICYLPLFHSGKDYQREKMRIIADILQEQKVSLVFSGMHHSYQRSKPLLYKPYASYLGLVKDYDLVLPGEITLDKKYDGRKNARPQGPMYVVTGTGGHELINPEQTARPDTWQPFTETYVADRHSFTMLDVSAGEITGRQLDADGKEIDGFVLQRS
jgi:hypothetical protein